ncbi:hypothetical protein BBJ29_008477 [Phytophthora kernoviae]|uniref:Large ribosomal subunit protein mL59 domain-containing protein n=1 Tax=Phytophthora kernoviae TaxID=325452 RepID=A0A3F2RFP6_9STRA|nr:hypothetical protein BBP00_00009058 [Phytophthora kernoviae]RLN70622.1 hypothetical protein BBJ29_008477 [Phytophthora kernoviae]
MQRFIRLSAAEAEAAMKPKLVEGKWMQPMISGRKVAMVKKHALRNGLVGTWEEGKGGWLESWDRPQKHHVMRPLKGHKNQRNEFERVKKVQAALEAMPTKIAEHKKALKLAKPLKGLDKWMAIEIAMAIAVFGVRYRLFECN